MTQVERLREMFERSERAYRAVLALPGPLEPEVCELVESLYLLAGALAECVESTSTGETRHG
jgi:hypothetical protein